MKIGDKIIILEDFWIGVEFKKNTIYTITYIHKYGINILHPDFILADLSITKEHLYKIQLLDIYNFNNKLEKLLR